MIRNYFKTAWRSLNKHRVFSLINIFGLASGMMLCMLAMIKIKDAYDYDNFHPNAERTYRITTKLTRKSGEHFLCASSPLPLANYLKNNNAIIENSTSVYFSNHEMLVDDRRLYATEAYVNEDFYKIFGFKLKEGQPAISPQTIVLTSETAKRFFGNNDPIGKVISLDSTLRLRVTGVLEKPLYPSHLRFDMLVSMSTLSLVKHNDLQNWQNEAAAYTYVQVKKGVTTTALKNDLQKASQDVNGSLLLSATKVFNFDVQPLDKISPGRTGMVNLTAEPNMPALVALSVIAFCILLVAFFNYVNLTLARSLDRAKEVGIRKVTGAQNHHVVLQFLSESVIVAILSFGVAFIELKLLMKLPTIQDMIGEVQQDATMWLYFLLFTLFTGLLAGWIPAKVFSGFQPVKVLKGKFNVKLFGGAGLRKALTVAQFAVSMAAIVALAVFYKQSIFMASSDYGFSKENMVTMHLPGQSYDRAAVSFASIPGVESVSASSGLFGFSEDDRKVIKLEKNADSIIAAYFSVTASFIKDVNLEFIAGKNFIEDNAGREAVINEEALRMLRFKNSQAAVGQRVWINDSTNFIIAGVVKDFHFAGFAKQVLPLVLANQQMEFRTLNLKVAPAAAKDIFKSIEAKWKLVYPHEPFEADWYNKKLYDQHYHRDDIVFVGLLTAIALSIACLGLLGMVIYTTKNRKKEIGIRKLMGAGVWSIIMEVSKSFMLMLVLAVCIGMPIGYFGGHKFLRQYAYQISINAQLLSECALILFSVGAITIGWHTFKAATANPVRNLREE